MCVRDGCAWEALWGSKYCATHLGEAGEETIREWRSYVQQNAQKLEKASLTGAPLDGINLRGANLKAANLFGAKLDRADLESANLQGARLTGASFKGAILARANLTDAKARGTDLDKADLTRAVLKGAELYAAKLRGSRLLGTVLADCDLREAKLEGAIMRKARLDNAILIEADMQHADLAGAALEGCDLSNANMRGANLTGASFTRYVKLPRSAQATLLKFVLTWSGGGLSKISAIFRFILVPALLVTVPFLAIAATKNSGIPSWAYIPLPLWPMILLGTYAAFFAAARKPEEMREQAAKRFPFLGGVRAPRREGGDAPSDPSSESPAERQISGAERLAGRILYPTVWNGAVVDSLGPCNPLDLRYIKDQSYLEAWISHISSSRWKRFWMFVWGLSCGYGDNVLLWVFWAALGRLSFGATFFIAGSALMASDPALTADAATSFYSSLVTFMTIGAGDAAPASVAGRIVFTMRDILGYVMLAGLLSLLTKRLARLA
ncbi:MAG TPA: pentapeptide repeat-containing protein [Candidatus Brocadiia bacterium]|nr:pentapeptide repeat-containing protein [Candidatus Brocadiia bacterium]